MSTLAEESSLIARILAGEKELFHELIRPYQRMAYMTALAILKDQSEAEDAAQEAIVKAYRALRGFRAEAKFSTWLVTIVTNEARSRLRKSSRVTIESLDEPRADGETYLPALIADWREIPSEVLERQELSSYIQKAIEDLPPSYREVFMLRDKEALSIIEIANLLQVQPNLVKVRLFRARMLLQRYLVPYLKHQKAPAKRRLKWIGGFE